MEAAGCGRDLMDALNTSTSSGDIREASAVAYRKDRRQLDIELSGYCSKHSAIPNQLLDLGGLLGAEFYRPANRPVVPGYMNGLRSEHFQILRSVVVPLLVDVVNDFAALQRSTDFYFSDSDASTNVAGAFVGARMTWEMHEDVPFVFCDTAFPPVSR